MPDYFVFGGCLRSELPFPELGETSGREPQWTLELGSLLPNDGAEVLSDAELSASCHVRVTRNHGAFRYAHSCTGAFDVSADGRRIVFEPSDKANLDAARTDFVARVLLLCVDHGVTWLHGSAVRIGRSAVAFLGASGAGKSTLALALARAGAQHICDDTLPLETEPVPMVWPSDHVIRLRPDSKGRFASDAKSIRRESDGKFVLTRNALASADIALASDAPGSARSPLSVLYLLKPVAPDARVATAEVIERRRIAPSAALPALMQHLKLGPVTRPEDPARMMRQLGAIARAVPVYELHVNRDWEVLDEVVTRIIAWQSEAESSSPANPTATIPVRA